MPNVIVDKKDDSDDDDEGFIAKEEDDLAPPLPTEPQRSNVDGEEEGEHGINSGFCCLLFCFKKMP